MSMDNKVPFAGEPVVDLPGLSLLFGEPDAKQWLTAMLAALIVPRKLIQVLVMPELHIGQFGLSDYEIREFILNQLDIAAKELPIDTQTALRDRRVFIARIPVTIPVREPADHTVMVYAVAAYE